MFYKPKKEIQWDSWIIYEFNKFFMFYINVSEGGTRWDQISLATSTDLIHWEEHGVVLKKDANAIWLGTGMIQKIDDRYIMNYSLEMPKNYQRIHFAESKDLYNWTKIENHICEPDPKYYLTEPHESCDIMPRWDSLGIFNPLSDDKPPYFAFCSANAKGKKLAGKSGVLGFVTSQDGINWKSLPPAFDDGNQFTGFEVPEYVSFNNRHYALFCNSSYLGFRCDERADWASGGTYYLVSDNKLGPYRLPTGDPLLQGQRDHLFVTMNYVGRTFKYNNKTLYYHIWGDPKGDAWMGPIKELVEIKPYKLGLKYYRQNEKIKDVLLLENYHESDFLLAMRESVQPSVFFKVDKNKISFTNNGSSNSLKHINGLNGVSKTDTYTDLRDGRFIEFDIKIDEGVGAGIYFETDNEEQACVFINHKKQRIELGFIKNGWGGNQVLLKDLYKYFEIPKKSAIKMIVRRYFTEVYINNNFVVGWRITSPIKPNNFGIYSEDSTGYIKDLKIWGIK